MIKKGDIFTAYVRGNSTENVMATNDFHKGLLLHCINADGEDIFVSEDEIGELLGNISTISCEYVK